MTPPTLAILLLAAGVVLLIAEALLPAGGLVGAAGALALAGCVVVCFRIDSRLGFGVVVAMAVVAPFAMMLWVKVLPKTFAGRRMFLGPVSSDVPAATVSVGQTGTTVSELRPVGMCDFGAERLEARAEHGTIPAGRTVQVVDVVDRKPTVRPI